MAEIRIQRRRRAARWPWLLVAALPFAYMLYWQSEHRESFAGEVVDSDTPATYMISQDTTPPPDALDLLTAHLAKADTVHDEAAERRYVSEALRRLADATGLLVAADAPSNQRALAAVQRHADAIAAMQRHSPEHQAGERVHASATAIADVLELSQRAAYPEAAAAVARVRVAAGEVFRTVGLARQHARVQAFLQASRDAIAAMHGEP